VSGGSGGGTGAGTGTQTTRLDTLHCMQSMPVLPPQTPSKPDVGLCEGGVQPRNKAPKKLPVPPPTKQRRKSAFFGKRGKAKEGTECLLDAEEE
jgi:hypothetical protein